MSERHRGFNLIITNSTYGEIFSIKLGVKRLYTLIALLIIVPIAFVVILLILPRFYTNSDEVESLKAENKVLKAKVDSVGKLKLNLAKIDSYSRYLRAVALHKGKKTLPALRTYMKNDSLKGALLEESQFSGTSLHRPSIKPVTGGLVSRAFIKGKHEALDISAKKGTPILASAKGVVQNIYFDEFLGNVIEVNHGGEYVTQYAHCETIIAQKNTKVERGDPIATVGNTGKESTGPHLHFVIKNKEGITLNPELLIKY